MEGSVGQITTPIVAKLRNRTFFDLITLNQAIRKELDIFNNANFQKRDGSRYSVYIDEEKPFMKPLPTYPYEYSHWKIATVQLNYHVAIDKMYYSVPYEYVKKKVDVKETKSMIEVFYKGNRIGSHKRLYGRQGQYSTNADHMPENHKLYSEWNSERFIKWSSTIGPSCHDVIERLLSQYKVEEQAYNGCLSLLKLSDKYTSERLEKACQLALAHISVPRYKNIRLILEAGQDKKSNEKSIIEDNEHAFIRGAKYYGGNENE